MASLMFHETVDFFQVKKNIKHREYNAEYGKPALEFPVFIKKNINRSNANQGDRDDEYPDIKACSQILKTDRLSRRFDISAIKRVFDGEESANSSEQEPDRLHSL